VKLLTLDFETFYDTDYSLKKMTTEEYIRDPRFEVIGCSAGVNAAPGAWLPAHPGRIETAFRKLDWANTAVLAHNTKFDGAILEWKYGVRPAFYFDTLSMAQAIHGLEGSLSLDALTQRYALGQKGDEVVNAKGKRLADFSAADLNRYGVYCSNDVLLTRKLFDALRRQGGWDFPTGELAIIDLMLRMFIRPSIMLDQTQLKAHLTEVVARKGALLARVEEIAGKDALMSNEKLAAVLRGLGVEPPMKLSPAALKRGEEKLTYAFGRSDLEFKALLDHDDERVQAIVAARMGVKSTQAETRAYRFIGMAGRGPFPVPLRYYAAHTGRAGGDDKVNVQNLPSRTGDLSLRRSIIAPPGHSIVTCDSAQIEARVLAYVAGQWDLVEDFRRKVDIYSSFASDVYGYPVDRKAKAIDENGKEYHPHKLEGMVGKEGILGLGFGMGGDKFGLRLKQQAGIDMEPEKSTGVVQVYRRRFYCVPGLWKQAQRAIEQMVKGYTATIGVGIKLQCYPADDFGPARIALPNGMFLRYPELRAEAGGKYGVEYKYTARKGRKVETIYTYGAKVVENIVQALARIIVFDQLLSIDRWMGKQGIGADEYLNVAMTVHDEGDAVAPDHLAEEVEAAMLRIMSLPPKWAPDLPIAAETGRGKNYADA
jgi:hypothetical protein